MIERTYAYLDCGGYGYLNNAQSLLRNYYKKFDVVKKLTNRKTLVSITPHHGDSYEVIIEYANMRDSYDHFKVTKVDNYDFKGK